MKFRIQKCLITGILLVVMLAGIMATPYLTGASPFILTAYAGEFSSQAPGGRHDIYLGRHSSSIKMNAWFSQPTRVRMLNERGQEVWAGDFPAGDVSFYCGTDVYTVIIHLDLDKRCSITW